MSESSDYSDRHYDRSHDFGRARQTYRSNARTTREKAKKEEKKTLDLLPMSVSTDAEFPLILAVDMTSSMAEGFPTYKSKAPYLQYEVKDGYLGDDNEICIMAFGDVERREEYAVQARPFCTGTALKGALDEVVHTFWGGGNGHEASSMIPLYLMHNAQFRAGTRPILIIFTDEPPHPRVTPTMAQDYARVSLRSEMSAEEIFAQAMQGMEIFVVLRRDTAYGGNFDARTYHRWVDLLGKDRVVQLPRTGYDTTRGREVQVYHDTESTDALRLPEEHVIDVTFGILAKIRDRIPYFIQELTERQDPWQVNRVLACLDHIFPKQEQEPEGRSELGDVKPLL